MRNEIAFGCAALANTALVQLAWATTAEIQARAFGVAEPSAAEGRPAIVVTGSRPKGRFSQPTPATLASTDQVTQSSPISISDGLNQLPQYSGSKSPSRTQSLETQGEHEIAAQSGANLVVARSLESATRLSAFGERPSFSPDGKKVAFIGKSYGDAYEIDLVTRQVRNLTSAVPHQGFLRVQYLANGDYLLIGPRRYEGPNSRLNVEMWILDKSLNKVAQPLGETLFEGVAVSRFQNLLSWEAFVGKVVPQPGQSWAQLVTSQKLPMTRFIAEISYKGGVPSVVNKREIMRQIPPACRSVEPQDFRDKDQELIFSCYRSSPSGNYNTGVMGYRLATDQYVSYRMQDDEYNEPEGVAADGTWTTVECGKQAAPGLPPLDICRLDLRPGGTLQKLVVATSPGSTRKVSNSVVSPDGRWVAFQLGDGAVGEFGQGSGIYIVPIGQ